MTEAIPITMSAPMTAAYLTEALGGRPGTWLTWLSNDRKPSRAKRWLPVEPGPGRPRYSKACVDLYISSVRAKGMQQVSASTESAPQKARRLVLHISPLTVDDGADVPVVLFVCANPLIAFNLSAAEARNIARRLNNAADEIDPQAENS